MHFIQYFASIAAVAIASVQGRPADIVDGSVTISPFLRGTPIAIPPTDLPTPTFSLPTPTFTRAIPIGTPIVHPTPIYNTPTFSLPTIPTVTPTPIVGGPGPIIVGPISGPGPITGTSGTFDPMNPGPVIGGSTGPYTTTSDTDTTAD